MNCKKCNTKTVVVDSASRGEKTYRKHKCKKCGYIFFTVERVDPEADYMISTVRYMNSKK